MFIIHMKAKVITLLYLISLAVYIYLFTSSNSLLKTPFQISQPPFSRSFLNENEERNFDFLILIKSAPGNSVERNLMRSGSWLSQDWTNHNQDKISWRHFFLVGHDMNPNFAPSQLKAEKISFGDVIICPTLDVSTRQAYSLFWGLRQLYDNVNFKFVVVIDESVVVNVRDLDKYLKGLVKEGKDDLFYGGSSCTEREVDRAGVFAVSTDDWPFDLYPAHCDGSALIYSYNTIGELLWVWDHDRQPVMPLVAAHIGVLLQLSGKISITEIEYMSQGCDRLRKDTFIMQHIQPLEIGVEMIERYIKDGVYCFENVAAKALI